MILDLISDASLGKGVLRFIPGDTDPIPLGEIWRRSAPHARWASSIGGPGGSIAAVLSSTANCIAALLGVWRSGSVLVSLPLPARGISVPAYTKQVEQMVTSANASALLVESGYESMIKLDIPVLSFDKAVLSAGPQRDQPQMGGQLIQFSSGSTASPKGIMLGPQAIATNVLAILDALDVDASDSACSWLPFSHDMGFIGMLLSSLVAMGTERKVPCSTFIDPQSFLSNPSVWLRTCSELGATITTAPNFAFDLAIRRPEWLRTLDLSKVRVCITGAERVKAETLRRFSTVLGGVGFRNQALCPSYGLAEATLAVTMVRPHEKWQSVVLDESSLGHMCWSPSKADDVQTVELVGNGRPIDCVDCRIATEGDEMLGEVEIFGESLFSGYLSGGDLRSPGSWHRTGDIGYIVDNQLFVAGRTDDMLIVGGRNIFAQDLEAIAAGHPIVRPGNCVAIAQNERYVLVLESSSQASDTSDLLKDTSEIGQLLLREAGVAPSGVFIVKKGSLPKTPSGKLQRYKTRELLQNGGLPILVRVGRLN